MPSDSVLSSAWYPGASAYDPAMFTFATGVKDHPVHLLDGNDRRVSCFCFRRSSADVLLKAAFSRSERATLSSTIPSALWRRTP